jgi:hypothetical protein
MGSSRLVLVTAGVQAVEERWLFHLIPEFRSWNLDTYLR